VTRKRKDKQCCNKQILSTMGHSMHPPLKSTVTGKVFYISLNNLLIDLHSDLNSITFEVIYILYFFEKNLKFPKYGRSSSKRLASQNVFCIFLSQY
jgi:hypothetical protein